MPEEKESSGTIFDREILSKVFEFVKPYRATFYLLVLLTITASVAGAVRPKLVGSIVDNFIMACNYVGLVRMSALVFGLILFSAITEYFSTYISGWLGQSIIRDVRLKLYNHLLKFRLSFYDKTPIGRLITRNISDIETISDIFTEGLADIAGSIFLLVSIVIFMLLISWKLTLISLAVIPLLLFCTYVFKEKVKHSFNDVRTAVANLNTFVQEHITGMNIVQIFNSEDREYEKFKVINKQHRNANLRSVLYYSVYFPVAEVLAAAGVGLLVWWGSLGVLRNEVTLGDLTAFIMYIQMFFRPIREIADKFNTLQMGIVGSSRVIKLLETTDAIQAEGTYQPVLFKGEIRFEQVSFAYVDENFVLRNISFQVQQGQTLAFVGATGAGKSSIINLINRFYEVNSGLILIDEVPIQDYNLTFLRSKIGVVMQDVFLFSGSIFYNITLGNPSITRDKVMEAAEAVGARDFIAKLPGGLDYEVMERGATLSVGQRQLISFIRAMVYDPTIIILDEATSSVDSETEQMIQKAMQKLLHGRTSVVIAHRLSTIQHADKIIVIDKGQIVESGTHDELLAEDGFYANLCRMQYNASQLS